MKNSNSEVLMMEAEEVNLENQISNALQKQNVTERVIGELKTKYGGLKLKSVDDKQGYLEIKESRKEVRKIGILVERICETGRSEAVKIQKLWLNKQKEVLGKIAEVQDPLDVEIKKFDDEVERLELEATKKREEIYMNRQSALSRLGATYNNGNFELKHISYEIELIKQADEEQWNDTILPKYKKVYEEIESAIVEEENKRKAENERLQKERDEFEEKQRLFRQQQEEFQKQKAEMQKQKDEDGRLEQQRIANERNIILRSRMDKLVEVYSTGGIIYYSNAPIINADELIDMAAERFEQWSAHHNEQAAVKRKEAEEKRLAQIEKEKQEAIELAAQQERKRIAEEQRQAEAKKQQEEQRKAEELAISTDKEKYADVVKYLKNTPSHAMKSNIYKGKMNAIAQFIENL